MPGSSEEETLAQVRQYAEHLVACASICPHCHEKCERIGWIPKEATMFTFGDPVTWCHEPRGGWGYIWHVPAYVVKATAKRVGIAAMRDSADWTPRWVTPDRLRHGHPSLVR